MGVQISKREGTILGVVIPTEKHWWLAAVAYMQKTAEPIKMPFKGVDSRGSKEPCIRRGQSRTNPFAPAKGDKMAMRPFVTILGPYTCYKLGRSKLPLCLLWLCRRIEVELRRLAAYIRSLIGDWPARSNDR